MALSFGSRTELKEAKSGIKALKARAADLERRPPRARKPKKREVRMYIDGCFDMMHFGHRCVRGRGGSSAVVVLA